MTIYEFADIINKEIEVKRFANQKERWVAQFENCEVKGNSVLIGEYGYAKSAIGAIQNYTYKIRGKTLVFGAHSKDRIEFVVPESITSPLK